MTEPDDPSGPKTPIDQALDVFVFLPVGFVLDLPHSIPRCIEVGRRQLHALGRLSVDLVSASGRDPGAALDRLQAQTRTTLRALGVGPESDGELDAGAGAWGGDRRVGRDDPRPGPSRPVTLVAVPSPVESTESNASSAPTASSEPASPVSGPDVEVLAIPDYDSLSASQVVPRLAGLNADELEAVRLYENAKRGRKTILSKIAQLQVS